MEIVKYIIVSLLIILVVIGIWHGFIMEIGDPCDFYFKVETPPLKRLF